MKKYEWDVFISHASEDKDPFARPLAQALEAVGLKVWYDETSLNIGDSLRRSIDRGLAHSKFGVVILSTHFFAKEWPQKELEGLLSREVSGQKVILPIWHQVNAKDIRRFSPILAGRVAISSEKGPRNIALEILRIVDPKRSSASTSEYEREKELELLIDALKSSKERVRWQAAESLGKLKDPRAINPLVAAFSPRAKFSPWAAVQALGEIGDARAVEPLIRALRRQDVNVRYHATVALGQLCDPRALPELHRRVEHDWDVRIVYAALYAIMKIQENRRGDPTHYPGGWSMHSKRNADGSLSSTVFEGKTGRIIAEFVSKNDFQL